MFIMLVVAAALEIGGDAAIRYGLVHAAWPAGVIGAAGLVAYGIMVSMDRTLAFNRLMGTYIAVFFVVSQLVAWAVFGERPAPSVVLGGILIVAGGTVIQAAAG